MVSSVAYASRALRPYPTSFFGNQPNPPKEKILPFGKVYLDRRNLSERPHGIDWLAIHRARKLAMLTPAYGC